MFGSRQGFSGSNGAICGSIKSKMAVYSHLGMTALLRQHSAGLSCIMLLLWLLKNQKIHLKTCIEAMGSD